MISVCVLSHINTAVPYVTSELSVQKNAPVGDSSEKLSDQVLITNSDRLTSGARVVDPEVASPVYITEGLQVLG